MSALVPENASRLTQLGAQHAREGYLFKAVSLLGRAWDSVKDPVIAQELAACLQRLGRSPQVLHLTDEALGLWPDLAQLHCCRGEAWLSIGAPAKAAVAFENALATAHSGTGEEPDTVTFRAWHGLGLALAQLQRWAAAAEAQRKALANRPRDPLATAALVEAQVALFGGAGAVTAIEHAGLDSATAEQYAFAFAKLGLWHEALTLLHYAASTPQNTLLAAEAHLILGDLSVTLAALDLVELHGRAAAGRGEWRFIRRQTGLLRLLVAWLIGDHAGAARLRTAQRLPTYLQIFQCALHDRGFRPRLSRGERNSLCDLLERFLQLQRVDLAERVLDLLESSCGSDPAGGPPLAPAEIRSLVTRVARLLVRYNQVHLAGSWLLSALKGEAAAGLVIPAGIGRQRQRTGSQAEIDRLLTLGDAQLALGEPMQATRAYQQLLAFSPEHQGGRLGLAAAMLVQAGHMHPTLGSELQRLGEEVRGLRQTAELRPDVAGQERLSHRGGGACGQLADR